MLNEGQYRLGILKHAPPSFKFFDPIETEGRPLIIMEVTPVTLGNPSNPNRWRSAGCIRAPRVCSSDLTLAPSREE